MFSLLDLIFVLSMHYVRKGSRAFYLNYPEINEVGKSNHMVMNRDKKCVTRNLLTSLLTIHTEFVSVQDNFTLLVFERKNDTIMNRDL